MDRKRKQQIWNDTKYVSISKGGNKLFRVGVYPSDDELTPINYKQNKFKIKPREYSGDFFYHLVNGATCYGFFWRHNGPTASWLYFKTRIQKNDDTSIICYHYPKKLSGIEFLISPMQKVLYEDLDRPVRGIDIFIEDLEFNKYGYSDSDFTNFIETLVNFMASQMVNENYFEMV